MKICDMPGPCPRLHTCKLCLRSPDKVAASEPGPELSCPVSSRLCPIMSVLCEYQHLIYNPSVAEPRTAADLTPTPGQVYDRQTGDAATSGHTFQ